MKTTEQPCQVNSEALFSRSLQSGACTTPSKVDAMKTEIEQFDMPRYLSVLPLFSDLLPEERERLARGCHLRRMTRGDMVFRMGDPCDAFYLVVLGQVKLYVSSPAGQEKIIELKKSMLINILFLNSS